MRNLIQIVTDQHPSSLICKLASFCKASWKLSCHQTRNRANSLATTLRTQHFALITFTSDPLLILLMIVRRGRDIARCRITREYLSHILTRVIDLSSTRIL